VLVVAALFHVVNINSFFGFIKTNPITSARQYAVIGLVSFTIIAVVYSYLL